MHNTKIPYWLKEAAVLTHHVGRGRVIRLGLALLIMGSTLVPVMQEIANQYRYSLDASTIRLVGETNKNLAKKISYDSESHIWQFNKDGIQTPADQASADPIAMLRTQIGGSGKKDDSLYSVDLPTAGAKGVRYYDNNTDLSFTVVPEFSVASGQARNGKLIYPITDGAKIVYTAMNNGMKEDIVLSHNIGNALEFRYRLNLPDTLEAKILDDGSVGIYSADPTLFGKVSFGSDMDREKLESARRTAVKDHLLFAIPAPVIKQTGSEQVKATAQFRLEGSELILYANNLDSLSYPASLDPSVVVTSTSDFSSGNNEGDINFANNQLNRGGLTGGTIGSWAPTLSFTNGRDSLGSVAYNGYLYVVGGTATGTSGLNDVQYAPINSDGTVGTWNPTTSMPAAIYNQATVAYNGYLYVIGGNNGTSAVNSVRYAPINSDGTVGTWGITASFTTARYDHRAVAYNGYMYIVGGTATGTSGLNDVQYAPINANGTLGTWTPTASFTTARYAHTSVAYNGYIYIMGGSGTSSTYLNDVQYAPLNSDGTVGTWTALTSFSGTRRSHTAVIYNGYLYVLGGYNGTAPLGDVQYAQVNANGTLGTWSATTSLSAARAGQAMATYNGYFYILGYKSGATYFNTVEYAKVNPAGVTGGFGSTTALLAETAKGKTYSTRFQHASVAYNGYVYVLGGRTSSPAAYTYNSTIYAPINADGTLGTWATTNTFTNARYGLQAVAYQGYMYILGGTDGTTRYNDVQYAPINADGTLGTWASTTSFTTARFGHMSVAYNGYLYVLGGYDGLGNSYSDVQYAPINSGGTIGAWAPTTSLTTLDDGQTSVVYNGYIYVMGGQGFAYSNEVQYAPITSNGTLGAWAPTASFTTGRYSPTSVVYNGYIYILGGSNGSYINDVQYAPINADGTLGTWATTTSFTTARYDHTSVVYDGNVYVIGGSNGTALDDVQYAKINNGGTGNYTYTNIITGLPAVREGLRTVTYNGYIYAIGGYDGTSYQNNVWYAPINSSGIPPNSWNSTTVLPYTAQGFRVTVNNGYMYLLGGLSPSGTPIASVYVAPINTDGTLGTWTSTTAIPSNTSGRYDFEAGVYNNYIYVVGGLDEDGLGTIYYNDVQYAPLNSDGTVGTWSSTALPGYRHEGELVIANGYMYILGGSDSGLALTPTNTVRYAPINTDGTLGSWKNTSSMQTARVDFQAVAYDGYIYAIAGQTTSASTGIEKAILLPGGQLGGWRNAGSLTSDNKKFGATVVKGNLYIVGGTNGISRYEAIEYGSLASIARIGHYSKLIDLGATVSLSGFTYNGLVPGGASAITFRTAGTDGILGAAASIGTLSGSGTGVVCGGGGGGGGTRYILIFVTLDDSAAGAVFADLVGPNNANLTDITVNWAGGGQHPQPMQRLHGGKFFQTEILQPLDTCGP
jgi:hypothetical protein